MHADHGTESARATAGHAKAQCRGDHEQNMQLDQLQNAVARAGAYVRTATVFAAFRDTLAEGSSQHRVAAAADMARGSVQLRSCRRAVVSAWPMMGSGPVADISNTNFTENACLHLD